MVVNILVALYVCFKSHCIFGYLFTMNNIEEKTLSDVKANELGTELGKRGETLESSLGFLIQ